MARRKRDMSWAAGLFEGEGHASLNMRKEKRNKYRNWSPGRRMAIAMTDKEPLEWFREIVRVGTIRPRKTPKDNKPMWVWDISAYFEILHVAMNLYPYLSPRRQAQLEEVTLIGLTNGLGQNRQGRAHKPLVLHPEVNHR